MSLRHLTLGYRLPRPLRARLFGDRDRFGLAIRREDPDWQEWERTYLDFYQQNQKESIGKIINDAGYAILREVPFDGRDVLEIGPGDLPHMRFWNGVPREFVAADVLQEMVDRSVSKLAARSVPNRGVLLDRESGGALPFGDASFDVIVSFYALEHLSPLDAHVREFCRVLRPGGLLVGAIPTEGGLAWGLGRFLTSRRWLHANSTVNPDKIICWEHSNFADHILDTLEGAMRPVTVRYWPLRVPVIDSNLIISFTYERPPA